MVPNQDQRNIVLLERAQRIEDGHTHPPVLNSPATFHVVNTSQTTMQRCQDDSNNGAKTCAAATYGKVAVAQVHGSLD
jgi:hypothetical protein